MPVPLPSTVTGALAAAFIQSGASGPKCERASQPLGDQEAVIEAALGCSPVLRGPYIYVEGEGYAVCSYLTSGKLACVSSRSGLERIYVVEAVTAYIASRVGVALSNDTRTVSEGYMYTSTYVDLAGLVRKLAMVLKMGRPKLYGILVELHRCEDIANAVKRIDGLTVSLGGEQVPVRVVALPRQPLGEIVSRHSGAKRDRFKAIAASPIVMSCGEIDALKPPSELLRDVAGCLDGDVAWLRPSRLQAGEDHTWRLTLAVQGLGFSMCFNARRPYYPAIMPGAVVELAYNTPRTLLDVYVRGLGAYSRLAWGTVIPLLDDTRAAVVRVEEPKRLRARDTPSGTASHTSIAPGRCYTST
jgi:hypothetical protein